MNIIYALDYIRNSGFILKIFHQLSFIGYEYNRKLSFLDRYLYKYV